MDLGLKGKNAVITGASQGIGKSIALRLAKEGVNVAICARREPLLREVENELLALGVNVFARICDVSNDKQLEQFLDHVKKQLGNIDILVNNVSALSLGDDDADWDRTLQTDVLSSVRATKKVLPWMKAAGTGNILFISSISALEAGSPPAYAAGKAALISYSKTMALQLAQYNIRVNTIAPGSIEFSGGLWEQAKEHNPEFYESVRSSIPFARLGTPDEVANVAAFVVSSCASWVTGTCISVDGGQHKGNL
jgi:3-oxoacyl-[acyl-carrier protein] reductase